jgi:hypothetical protein
MILGVIFVFYSIILPSKVFSLQHAELETAMHNWKQKLDNRSGNTQII